jgi:hypothetical protein
MMIQTCKCLLPAHWASYLINGDGTGLTDEEYVEVQRWERRSAPGPCIDVAEDADFTIDGDDGGLACDRAVFTFQLLPDP